MFAPFARRGNYTGLLILSLPVVLGGGAIVVDLSTQKVIRTQLQAVADIAAMAGTEELDGTQEGLERARAKAARAAARNTVNGRLAAIHEDDLLTGAWRPAQGELDVDAPVEEIDSLQVAVGDGAIPTTLARIAFNDDTMSASGASTGFRPPDEAASAIGCYLPLAIASCLFDLYTVEQLNEITLVVNPAGIDNAGWGRVGASPSASFARDQLRDCEQDGIIEVGDQVGLMNGVASTAVNEVHDQLKVTSTRWDPDWGTQPPRMSGSALSASQYGRTLEGAIIVFDGGSGYCQGGGGSFNGSEPLVGFAWAAIYDVRTSGSSTEKNIKLKLDTYVDRSIGLRGGGGTFAGVTWQPPPLLVR